MLLKFKVENFRSYGEPAELSLLRGTKQRAEESDSRVVRFGPNGPDVLRAAAIFGPNAGGKSNLLKAIMSLQRAVLRSAADAEVLQPLQAFASSDFRSKPIHFEIEFIAEELQISYVASFFDSKVLEESLASKPLDSKALPKPMFHRRTRGKSDEVGIEFFGELKDHPDLDQWRRNTRPHQLFLSQSQNLSAAPFFRGAFDWFRSKLCTITITTGEDDDYASYTRRRLNDAASKRRIVNELIAADLGISEIKVRTTQVPYEGKIVDGVPLVLSMSVPSGIDFVHAPSSGSAFNLDFKEESDGTRFFFSLLGPLDDVIQKDRVLLVDELDRSLHPLLVRRIVRAFAQGTSKSQLIFTTHDATLLDAEVLRRDQVWFAERDAQHRSSLRRLASGSVRLDKALMRAYLDGQFQGVPITDSQGAFGDA